MKKASTLFALLFVLAGAVAIPSIASAQIPSRGTVKKSSNHGKRSSRTTRTTRTTRSHGHATRGHAHHSTRTHVRSGVRVHVGWPYTNHYYHHGYHYPHHGYHYPHHSYRHTTVVYDRTPNVVVVEAEPQFEMPGLECPIRTREERSGLQQWCATSRGTRHGLYRRWYDSGVLAAQGEYEYDVQAGVWVEYHANGAIREEGAYADGARSGTWVTWGSDGEELVVVDY